ncbi:MAG: patatin-like phospholipase family protein [Candidatus Marinimicrobia bacterium]|nr:patatin-like phospholipase family protein [Candidatus Neomarinimicrobiota bacterium]
MKKDIALVLSSGGAKGFAHVGVIQALERHGFNITSVAGTSMGSLVGGLYATGELNNFLKFIDTLDLFEVLKLTDFTVSNKGLVKGDRIIERMKEMIPDRNIEDLDIPYCAIATDIVNGKEKVFTSGKLYDAIRASISIPTVFKPVKIDGHFYVDGGVLNPIPINRVARKRRDIVIAVNVNAAIPPEKKEKETPLENKYVEQIKQMYAKIGNLIPKNKTDNIGYFNLTTKTINLMLNQISEMTLEQNSPDILINISNEQYGTFDFYKAKEIIATGDNAAEKAIKAYLKK